MTKDEFLSILDRKLQVINEKERRDIIDEYRTHIEMKMQEGKSEEEAIEDFGDVDELVNDILDAYKINTDRVHHNFDAKVNRFMDELYDGFKRFLGSFTSLEVDDVVRLIFEIFIILVLLAILRIPFEIISSIGSSLLHSLIGLGVGTVLAGIWRLIINIAYIVVFVAVLVNLISKRVNRYRGHYHNDAGTVFEDFKSSVHDMTNKRQRQQTIYDERNDQSEEANANHPYGKTQDEQESAQFDSDIEEEIKGQYEYQSTHAYANEGTLSNSVGNFASALMKMFFLLLLIPFLGVIIALCCALGAMIVLSFEGLTLIGAYFIVIGGLITTGAFLTLIHRVLWRRR